jgi:hypothetical protein
MKRVYAMLSIVALWTVMGTGAVVGADNVNNTGIAVPPGAVITVRMIDGINSDANYAGQTFRASLDAPVVIRGRTVFPRGANANVRLVRVESAGKLKGRSRLELQLASIQSHGRIYPIQSNVVIFRGSSQGKKTGKSAGIGAAVGGGLGALFGGGKGAAIGAGLGAGTGVATRAMEGGKPVFVSPESPVTFRLTRPVHVAG